MRRDLVVRAARMIVVGATSSSSGVVIGLGVAAALGGASLVATGCVARVEPDAEYPVAEYDVPPAIEQGPSVVYEGRPVYYYRDHWYFRRGNRWHYYRHEPRELEHRRPARPVVEHERERR